MEAIITISSDDLPHNTKSPVSLLFNPKEELLIRNYSVVLGHTLLLVIENFADR
jgi:hypothetical protein